VAVCFHTVLAVKRKWDLILGDAVGASRGNEPSKTGSMSGEVTTSPPRRQEYTKI